MARRAGAAYAVVSVAHKVSSLITSMDIWIFDVSSGAPVAHLGGQIRGDTAEAYEHGVRFLVRNRLPDDVPSGEAHRNSGLTKIEVRLSIARHASADGLP